MTFAQARAMSEAVDRNNNVTKTYMAQVLNVTNYDDGLSSLKNNGTLVASKVADFLAFSNVVRKQYCTGMMIDPCSYP